MGAVVVVVEGTVVVVVVARAVVVVTTDVVVVVGDKLVEVVLVVLVVCAILAELLAALGDGWLVHAAVANATAVTAHAMWPNRRGRGLMSIREIRMAAPLATPTPFCWEDPRRIRSSSKGAVRGR